MGKLVPAYLLTPVLDLSQKFGHASFQTNAVGISMGLVQLLTMNNCSGL